MKTSVISIGLVLLFLQKATSQSVILEIDTFYGFWHDASLTTQQANVLHELHGADTLYYKCRITFNFTAMTMEFDNFNESFSYKVVELKRYDKFTKTFNASINDPDNSINYNFVLSEGVDKNDGIVCYIRYAGKHEGKDVVYGRFCTNVEIR